MLSVKGNGPVKLFFILHWVVTVPSFYKHSDREQPFDIYCRGVQKITCEANFLSSISEKRFAKNNHIMQNIVITRWSETKLSKISIAPFFANSSAWEVVGSNLV